MIRYEKLTKMEDVAGRNDLREVRVGIRRHGDGGALGETLLEVANPQPFKFYDYVGIRNFAQHEERGVEVGVDFALLEKQKRVEAVGHFHDRTSGDYIGSVVFPTVEDANEGMLYQYVEIGDAARAGELAVVVDLTITHGDDTTTTLSITSVYCATSNPELNPTYQHIYPKKEDVTVIFGDDPSGDLPSVYTHDPDNVVISLFRAPQDAGDSDYVCNYGHSGAQAVIGIPAKGVVKLARGVEKAAFVNDGTDRPMVTITPMSGAGRAFTLDKLPDGEFSNGDFQYAFDTNWGVPIDTEGDLRKYNYRYEAKFKLVYNIREADDQILEVIIASNVKGLNTPSQLHYQTLPLIIMWGCVARGTLVTTASGDVPIEEVKIGDEILTRDGKTKVTNVWSGPEEKVVLVSLAGAEIRMTKDHPVFLAKDEKFERASNLKVGDELLDVAGKLNQIERIETVDFNDKVYNLSTESNSGFFANGMLTGDMYLQNNEEVK
jgi:hypothetical protein